MRPSLPGLGCLLLLLCGTSALYGQQPGTTLQGTVTDPSGAGVADCYVMVCGPRETVFLSFATTNARGEFTLSFAAASDSVQIKTSRLDFAPASLLVPNRSGRVDLVITPQATVLKDIVIRPQTVQRRGDTLDYYVQRFATPQDISIGDVIRKLPGIEVRNNGMITYQGKAINEFMVENMDLMGGRYGGIVNNLSFEDVASVQILENHEPIRAMKEISNSDQAAINLTLKEDSKNKYLLSLALGVGAAPILWDNEASLMQFAIKKQTNLVYKGNNVGKTSADELTSFYGNDGSPASDNPFLSIPGSTPPLQNTERYLNNNIHTLNLNRLYAIGKYGTLSLQGDGYYDKQVQESVYNTFYTTDTDTTVAVREQTVRHDQLGNARAAIIYRLNAPTFFLTNTLRGQGHWTGTEASVQGSTSALNQRLWLNNYAASNHFSLFRVVDKKRLEVTSVTSYNHKQEQLTVSQGAGGLDYLQPLQTTVFQTNNQAKLGGKAGSLHYDLQGGVDYSYSALQSHLLTYINDVSLSLLDVYAAPSVRLAPGRWILLANIPTHYTYRGRNGGSGDSGHLGSSPRQTKGLFFLDPSLTVRYEPGNVFKFFLRVAYNHNFGDITTAYDQYILENYRTLSKGTDQWVENKSASAYLRVSINRAERLSNTYLTLSYSSRFTNVLLARTFDEIIQYRMLQATPTQMGSFHAFLMYSKGFDIFLKKLSVTPSYSLTNSSQVQSGNDVDNRTTSLGLSVTLDMKPWEDSDIRYAVGWTNSRSANSLTQKVLTSNTVNSLSQTMSFQSRTVKDLYLRVACEYRKVYSPGNHIPSTFFLDANLIYKFKQVECSLDFANLLNSKEYALKSLGNFSYAENVYLLRPRNVMLRARFYLR